MWSSQSMQSGGGFPFPGVLLDFVDEPPPVSLAPSAPLPLLRLPFGAPSLTAALPPEVMSEFVVSAVTVGFGDPATDNAWWRKSSPHDLAANVRARSADGIQSTHLQYHVNDTVPRRIPEDLLDPNYAANQAFEWILFPTCLYLEALFDSLGVERTFHVGPGLHNNDPYQQPYYREILEGHWNNLAHPDGGGSPRPMPAVFDYRAIEKSFTIWGWTFAVDRAAIEFLYLTDVSCSGLTLRGTGRVTFTSACDGIERTVDLGPSQPVDEPLGLGAWRGYGRTVRVDF